MRALLLRGFGDVVIGEVPDPEPGPEDVVIDVACVQPSVTECMLIAGEQVPMRNALASALASGPARFGGHEFCGVVRETGAAVTGVRPGDQVTAVETAVCGTCAACRRARPDACVAPEVLGFTKPGAFAERVLVPYQCVVAVPPGVSASAAAAIQPLAGAIHAHALAAVLPGESMLVIGTGVMGLLGVQVACHGAAGLILAAGRSPAKLALAEQFGADVVLGADADVVAAVREATEGVGVDVVIETAGGPPSVGLAGTETLTLAARCVRRGGRIVVVSVLPRWATAPLGLLRERSVALLHPRSGAGGYSPSGTAFEHALRLVQRFDVDVESLVTHRLHGIEELPKALEITRDKTAHGALGPAQVNLAGRRWVC